MFLMKPTLPNSGLMLRQLCNAFIVSASLCAASAQAADFGLC